MSIAVIGADLERQALGNRRYRTMCGRRRAGIQCPSRTGCWSPFKSSRHRRPSVTTKDAKPPFRQAGRCRS